MQPLGIEIRTLTCQTLSLAERHPHGQPVRLRLHHGPRVCQPLGAEPVRRPPRLLRLWRRLLQLLPRGDPTLPEQAVLGERDKDEAHGQVSD